ncbi:hypothetical protein [Streptomyces sp. AF1B]|uniref:hypothetical protein n=1 Tax=Streptomyces sp. AF1B TaxID=3399503 RepID=UPI003AAE52FD
MRKFQRAAVVAAAVAGLSALGTGVSMADGFGGVTAVASSQANAVAGWGAPSAPQAAPQAAPYFAPTNGFNYMPQAGYAAPQAGYAAPQTGYATPEAGYAAPQTGYATPQAGYGQ